MSEIGWTSFARRARGLSVLTALAAAALVAGCASGSARPKPAELPPNVAVMAVRPAWTARIPAVAFPLQVHVQGNQVFVAGSDGTVVALDAATGGELGRASVGEPITAGVGSDGQLSAVVTRTNQLIALQGGNELWRHRLPTQSFTAPLVAGGRVFVLSADRSLHALDGRSGDLLWSLQRPAEPLVLRQAGALFAVGNTLVAGLAGRMVGIDPDSGNVRWEAPVASARGTNDVERLVDLVAGVRRQGNTVCARAFQTAVGCVDAASGNLLWTRPANGATGVDGDAERIFGTEADGRVIAWRAASGDRAWASERLQWRHLSAPLVLDRALVVGDSTGLVHFLSREDGSPLNRVSTDGSGIAAAPVTAAGTVVVVTRNGGVFGFRVE